MIYFSLHRAQASSLPCGRTEGKEGLGRAENQREGIEGLRTVVVGMPAIGGGGCTVDPGCTHDPATMYYGRATWQRREGLMDAEQSTNTHECTENGRPEKERIPFCRAIEDRKRGGEERDRMHERMRDLPSLEQAMKFSTDLLRFQESIWRIRNACIYTRVGDMVLFI